MQICVVTSQFLHLHSWVVFASLLEFPIQMVLPNSLNYPSLHTASSSTGSSLWFILSPSLESKKGSAGFVPCCFCLTQGAPSRKRQRDRETVRGREEGRKRRRERGERDIVYVWCVCVPKTIGPEQCHRVPRSKLPLVSTGL